MTVLKLKAYNVQRIYWSRLVLRIKEAFTRRLVGKGNQGESI